MFLLVIVIYFKASQGTITFLWIVIVMCFYGTREIIAVISAQADEDRNKRPPSRFIFIQAMWQALLCLSHSRVKGLRTALKPWKLSEWRDESDSCGNAITFNKKRKLNALKERASVKNFSTHGGPWPNSDITKTGLRCAFAGQRFFKKFAWLPAKVIKL